MRDSGGGFHSEVADNHIDEGEYGPVASVKIRTTIEPKVAGRVLNNIMEIVIPGRERLTVSMAADTIHPVLKSLRVVLTSVKSERRAFANGLLFLLSCQME